MVAGKGNLLLRDGRRIPITYQFGSDFGESRAGYLLCDTSKIDATALFDRLTVECDNGPCLVVAVMHSSDHYLAITGRLLDPSSQTPVSVGGSVAAASSKRQPAF
ncbi:hypothetical protein J2X48_001687 [Bosea sp. BE271]|uniref:hypothetical protein n=1 Tax=Bosea TaxID=85413 RepID=UPI002740B270|nr:MULTISPECIES: hypothetical protein [Bosea]MDR6827958.1 hypothetical protein [Bosea robiniae]MDR6894892.1 hypothetical protein [Bosea sp. BE109]MDR7138064.1 hypothetical protein [Bosea sp. BE168]MDR7174763.1 hypothetical protein [Bosea sp. BE271]